MERKARPQHDVARLSRGGRVGVPDGGGERIQESQGSGTPRECPQRPRIRPCSCFKHPACRVSPRLRKGFSEDVPGYLRLRSLRVADLRQEVEAVGKDERRQKTFDVVGCALWRLVPGDRVARSPWRPAVWCADPRGPIGDELRRDRPSIPDRAGLSRAPGRPRRQKVGGALLGPDDRVAAEDCDGEQRVLDRPGSTVTEGGQGRFDGTADQVVAILHASEWSTRRSRRAMT